MSKKNDDIFVSGRLESSKKCKDHISHPEVDTWLSEEDLGFMPSHQQETFRVLAYAMAKRKRYFRGEWFEATADHQYMGVRINERTWDRWCSEDQRFKIWFYDDFPYVTEVGEAEFQMMDSQYWSGVRDAMSDGEEWAYRQYAKTRFESAAAKKDASESEALVELRGYFAAGNGDAWSAKPGEA